MLKSILFFFILLVDIGYAKAQNNVKQKLNEKEIIANWKADSLFNQGAYELAINFYKAFEPQKHFTIDWPVKKSLCYLLVGDTLAAQNYMKHYVSKGGHYMYVDQIKQIPLYESIAPNENVRNQFQSNTYAFEHSDSTCLYPEVLKTLLEMRELDQAYRQGRGNPNVSSRTIDSLNQIKLDSLIHIYGWLGYREVGKSGENASFLIAQHADNNLIFQKRCLALILEELFKGNVYPSNYALLYDRDRVNSGEAQLFGSQVELDEASNKFKPKKTVSMELVNAYRLYFGLDTIESYLGLMNKEFNND
ncbi:MAG: hypothetical protein RLZZ306_2805 [Bacteroidota bacterium]|jgi:hypothetical protein